LGLGLPAGLLLHTNRMASSERGPSPIPGSVRREESYPQLLTLASAEKEPVPTVVVGPTRARC
jgi:hypothetical protein